MRRKNKYSRGRSSAVKLGGGGRGGSIKTEPKTMTASEKAATDDSKIIHHDEDFFAKFNNLSLRETSKERGLSTSNNGKKNSKKMSPRGEEQKKGKKKMNILPAMPMPSLKKAVVVDISKATVSSLNGIGGKPKKKKNPNGKNAVAVLAAQDQDENSSPNTMYHGSYNVGVYPEYYYYHHPNNQVYYQSNEVYHHGDESYYYHGQGHVVEEGCYYQDDGGAYYQDEESYGQYDSQYYHYPYHYDTDGMVHHYQYFPTVAAEQYPLNVHAEEYSPDDQE